MCGTSRQRLWVGIAFCALAAAGCQKTVDSTGVSVRAAPTTVTTSPSSGTTRQTPSSVPSTTPVLFDDTKDGIQFQYLPNWVAKPSTDYVLQLNPAAAGEQRILFDVPDLPPHLPGMIRLGLIEHGYVGDLKETHKDAKTDISAEHPMKEGAQARLVESSWTQEGKPWKNIALLIMRNDHVYILSCRSDADHFAATRADFEKVMGTLHWTK